MISNTLLFAGAATRERQTDNEAYAWFTQADYDMTELIEITLGLRYTWERRVTDILRLGIDAESLVPGAIAAGGGIFLIPNGSTPNDISDYTYSDKTIDTGGAFKDTNWSPMFSVSFSAWDALLNKTPIDEAMLYITYSEGFRSGGVVEASGINAPAGSKLHLDEFNSETVTNWEIGLKLDALENKLRANIAAYYMEYEDMTRVPEKQVYLSGEHHFLTNFGTIVPRLDFSYRSKTNHSFDRDSWLSKKWISDSSVFIGARLSFSFNDDQTIISLWGKNLSNHEDHRIGGVPLASFTGGGGQVYAEPRTFGMDLEHHFGTE